MIPPLPRKKRTVCDSEQAIRDELVKQWPSFLAADKTHCVNEAVMGGESSYTELLTCLEMARDVRAMRTEQENAVQWPKTNLRPPTAPRSLSH